MRVVLSDWPSQARGERSSQWVFSHTDKRPLSTTTVLFTENGIRVRSTLEDIYIQGTL